MADFSIPLAGMQRAEDLLNRTAERLASLPLSTSDAPVDTVDLSAEMVALIEARNMMAVNVKAAQTADEMARRTLDLLG